MISPFLEVLTVEVMYLKSRSVVTGTGIYNLVMVLDILLVMIAKIFNLCFACDLKKRKVEKTKYLVKS